ncbi:16S rRNA (adenine(1518)-N(6)/adenine(1519)-N(6))-dimethyltransferase RsmA [Desulfonatronovibrio magnus]|uniref:16S rRNA (adenine(1518)-N(6)/adenine(1519)-N(6))- dimethyltransferase RsmA n=1 Tax=Desulfonatronovibrio magnus TaxID=698827 RepID=UPI0005EB2E6A|nr:16S rRNA (adenine(1518)-N(6)/adenine(1519)-N(6))-dimethyltransferase RsmA [Desulfonatronovibrio magnus]RQD68103.1 MAG: ribosomal RNA small subunit methyltransferase A [Desulfonatronovibrio sp. MSAO_Bac4]
MSYRAKKSLGQNFLTDGNIAGKIVDALGLEHGDDVLEIGPGQGALTKLLILRQVNLTALEKDWNLCLALKKSCPQAGLICIDALKYDWAKLHRLHSLKIVGNLPYNIGTRLIWDITAQVSGMKCGVFMLQKEVAQRIVSPPGSKKFGAISVWVQSHVRAELLFNVSPQVFRPKPKVESAVLRFSPLEKKGIFSDSALAKTLSLMFQSRRKQIKSILKAHWNVTIENCLDERSLDLRCRPEDLSPHDFQVLSSLIFSDD